MSAVRTIYAGGLTFDYAHMIPGHAKCGRLHGHTSRVRAAVTGELDELGMVIDFGVLKHTLEDVLDALDHRLLVNRRYVEDDCDGRLRIEYLRDNGPHCLDLPADEVVLLEGEPTIEAIADLVLERLCTELVRRGYCAQRIEVECTEGEAKGAIASLETAPI